MDKCFFVKAFSLSLWHRSLSSQETVLFQVFLRFSWIVSADGILSECQSGRVRIAYLLGRRPEKPYNGFSRGWEFDILMPGRGFRLTGCTRDGADIRRTGREGAGFGAFSLHPDCPERRATRGEIDENLPQKPFLWWVCGGFSDGIRTKPGRDAANFPSRCGEKKCFFRKSRNRLPQRKPPMSGFLANFCK